MAAFTVELAAPQEALFDFLADPRNRCAWQSSIRELQVYDNGEPRVGLRWWEKARGFGSFEMEITRCERPSAWAERGRGDKGEIELALDFQQGRSAATTCVVVSLELQLRRAYSLLGFVAPHALRPLMTRDLGRAAAFVRSEEEKSKGVFGASTYLPQR